MKQFYLTKDGQNYGPMTVEQMMQSGIDANSLVWADGMQDWTPAGQVAEFMPFFAPQQPVQPVAPVQPQPAPVQQPVQPQYQQPAQPQYQQPAQPQYQQPAQPQYQQPVQPQYQQPVQPQYQQPVQPQYAQPMPQYAQPMGVEEPKKKGPVSQLIFRIISFIPAVSFMVLSFICLIFAFIALVAGGAYGVLDDVLSGLFSMNGGLGGFVAFMLLLWFILLFVICLLLFIRLIKNRGFGILGMGFYLVLVLLIIISAAVSGEFAVGYFFMFLICAACVFFAAVPVEDLGNGAHYKKLFAEASVMDYILIGLFFLIPLILFFM